MIACRATALNATPCVESRWAAANTMARSTRSGYARRPLQGLLPTQRSADHRQRTRSIPSLLQQQRLHLHPVAHRHHRETKAHTACPSAGLIDRRAGRAIARPQHSWRRSRRYLRVSIALPGPITVSHQPGCFLRYSRPVASACLSHPATWASPERAWQISTTLSFAVESVAVSLILDIDWADRPRPFPGSAPRRHPQCAAHFASVQPTERGESGGSSTTRRARGRPSCVISAIRSPAVYPPPLVVQPPSCVRTPAFRLLSAGTSSLDSRLPALMSPLTRTGVRIH